MFCIVVECIPKHRKSMLQVFFGNRNIFAQRQFFHVSEENDRQEEGSSDKFFAFARYCTNRSCFPL